MPLSDITARQAKFNGKQQSCPMKGLFLGLTNPVNTGGSSIAMVAKRRCLRECIPRCH